MKKKFKKWLPGRKESTGWKESPLKQTDRHNKSPGGFVYKRQYLSGGNCNISVNLHRVGLPHTLTLSGSTEHY
ncbi:hypothetical protein GH098_10835 [Escherichia coli]|uniref:Uncharacterized protein n=2 Tax=Escherichia coli TaxID=562 RepID=A0A2G8YFE0_ECOLX|nr:hypothetical protein ECP_0313 [Escherichia coli 536]AKK41986.1 hypothetical protein NMECO18_01195 [Escherichia coli]AXY48597.1 hypothetical protein CIW80_23605 [Escherichia coli Nissle 1917]EAZ6893323.1 hypothetical protein [Salmonella enterica]EFJ63350.1 hypothetical protein HMPREF9553_00522 [Escherichia coli MS 200-1]EFJ92264.1 hypothetical protein HMPREF9531_02652 [Escherichia coli MS 45-1]EFN6664134.1 hypothetical protein [Escherichia coli O7:H7]EFN6731057.1 hypothetical protein [Esch